MSQEALRVALWEESHPRLSEFIDCLKEIAPEQAPFVLGDYARHLPCTLLVALLEDGVVGFLRFGVQPVGTEENAPPPGVTEAKIHAFAVRPEARRRGIGTALQRAAIDRARDLGCHQLASHTSYDRPENLRIKLALGFCLAPDGEGGGVRTFMPLRIAAGSSNLPPHG